MADKLYKAFLLIFILPILIASLHLWGKRVKLDTAQEMVVYNFKHLLKCLAFVVLVKIFICVALAQ